MVRGDGMSAYAGLAVSAVVIVAFIVFMKSNSRNELRDAVRMDLDAGYQVGGFNDEGFWYGLEPEEIANDLSCFGAMCGGEEERVLVPHVRRWLLQKGL